MLACAQTNSKSIDQLAERLGVAFGDPCRTTRMEWAKAGEMAQGEKSGRVLVASADLDPDHPLFGRTVAFTGPLVSMERSEAMQRVADVGGRPADSVTKKTDFLVVGGRYFDVFSHKTTKLQKATEMIAKGSHGYHWRGRLPQDASRVNRRDEPSRCNKPSKSFSPITVTPNC